MLQPEYPSVLDLGDTQSPSLTGQAVKRAYALGHTLEYESSMCYLLALCSGASMVPALSLSSPSVKWKHYHYLLSHREY